MADAERIEALLAAHQNEQEATFQPREKAIGCPEGRFVVDFVDVRDFIATDKVSGQEVADIPTFWRITEILDLRDERFTEDEVKDALIYGPRLYTSPGRLVPSRAEFCGAASLIAGQEITDMNLALKVFQKAKEEGKDGKVFRMRADGVKRSTSGYVNLRVKSRVEA